MKNGRPTFFNLLQIQMPVGALTSITHRLTGILLALAVPYGVFLLGLSLQGPRGYAEVAVLFDGWIFRGATVLVIWALAHHLLAGVRHFLMDIDVGSSLTMARRTAWTANLAGAGLAVLAAAVLL